MDSRVESEYEQWSHRFVAALDAAAAAHDSGDLTAIEAEYEEVDARLPRNNDPRYDKLHIALNFWGGWIDARNHDWLYYEGISPGDWSVLARQIARELRDDQEIGDERVLRHFDLRRRRPSLWERIRGLLGGRSAI